jgi:hypothetical protein
MTFIVAVNCLISMLALVVGFFVGRRDFSTKNKHKIFIYKLYGKLQRNKVNQYFDVLNYFYFDTVEEFPWIVNTNNLSLRLNRDVLEKEAGVKLIQKIRDDIKKLGDVLKKRKK